jgi:L-threonylcarbamoyladenylate synthase
MKTIRIQELEERAGAIDEIVAVIAAGGLVCLPCRASYRIVADLGNEQAVGMLLQSKRRTSKAPSLVFVADRRALAQLVAEVDPLSDRLARQLWPGPLTILFDPHPDLPAKVVRQLCKANGKLGVRIPADQLVLEVIRRLGRPVLVSSANKEKKTGAGSPAQVRKTFVGKVDLFVDAGDLRPGPSSTVVVVQAGRLEVTRAGAISQEQLDAIVG